MRLSVGLRLLLVGLAAIGPFSLNVFKPCLPWIKAGFGAPIATVQLALTLSIFAAAVATVLAGPIADAFGRRPLALACVYLYVVSCIVGMVAPTVHWVIAARIVQAASSSVAMVVARAMIHDRKRNAERTIARVTIVAVLAVLMAPALGGLVIEHLGWRAVFGLTAVVGLLLIGPVHHSLREGSFQPARRSSRRPGRAQIGQLLVSPTFAGYAMQSSLHFAVFFTFTSAATYLMVDSMGRSATEYGLWFLLIALFVLGGLVTADRLSGRLPPGRMAWAGSVLVMMGCVISAWILCATELVLTPALLFLPATFSGFGMGLALPSTNAVVMKVVPDSAGTASGLLGFAQLTIAAVFAQVVVQDEPNTAIVLGWLMLLGGVGGVVFGLLSLRHGARGR